MEERENEKMQQIIMRQLKRGSEVSKGENGNRKNREERRGKQRGRMREDEGGEGG